MVMAVTLTSNSHKNASNIEFTYSISLHISPTGSSLSIWFCSHSYRGTTARKSTKGNKAKITLHGAHEDPNEALFLCEERMADILKNQAEKEAEKAKEEQAKEDKRTQSAINKQLKAEEANQRKIEAEERRKAKELAATAAKEAKEAAKSEKAAQKQRDLEAKEAEKAAKIARTDEVNAQKANKCHGKEKTVASEALPPAGQRNASPPRFSRLGRQLKPKKR
jgi:hypothetical protein